MYRRPETKAAEEKVYRQKQIGEFMTTWKDFPRPGLAAWAERPKAGLMGTAKSTRYTPRFRPFDMLSIPNQSLVILENEYHRIGVESVVGVQESFHRYIDCGHGLFPILRQQHRGNRVRRLRDGARRSDAGSRRHRPSLDRTQRQPALLLPEPRGGGLRDERGPVHEPNQFRGQAHRRSQLDRAAARMRHKGAGRGADAFLGRRAGRPDGGGARLRIARRRRRTAGAASREVSCASCALSTISRRSSARAAKTPAPSR